MQQATQLTLEAFSSPLLPLNGEDKSGGITLVQIIVDQIFSER